MWQEITAGIIIAGALFYLINRFFGKKSVESGCSGCGAETEKKA